MKKEIAKNLCSKWQTTATHDNISLPLWGPYSKRFFGISHIADSEKGYRSDFFFVPSLYRKNPSLPLAKAPFHYTPWEADQILSYYSYRQQMMWKDILYMQGEFAALPRKNSFLCRASLVNQLDCDVEFTLHFFSMLALNDAENFLLKSAENLLWLDAGKYTSLSMENPSYYEGINLDGYRNGCWKDPSAIHAVATISSFGEGKGDFIQWDLSAPVRNKKLFIRYKLTSQEKITILVNGKKVILPKSANEYAIAGAGSFSGEKVILSFAVPLAKNSGFFLDGIALGENLEIQKAPRLSIPEIYRGKAKNSLILKFPHAPFYYGIRQDRKGSISRSAFVENLENTFQYLSNVISDPTSSYFDTARGEDGGYDICLQPIEVKAGKKEDIYFLLTCAETLEEAQTSLQDPILASPPLCRKYFAKKQKKHSRIPENAYSFSQERMRAVTMTNIVFPIRLNEEYIRHFTPGRCWDSLYTWDSGFTGLGLLEIDPARAAECLNTYTCPEEDDAPFILHGTPLATQILLFHELLNRSCSREFLVYFYPRVKKMHDFLSGLAASSNTAKFSKAGLLRSWKYGYNSGGWDDYPAQQYVHKNKAHHILPVITSAFCIRTAKILANWADVLHKKEDALLYRTQAKKLTQSIQKYSWNEKSGYFSYTVHDEKGNYKGHFLMEDGTDWNMGLDGVSPLICAAVTKKQHQKLWQKLRSEKHFRSLTGISTVDMSAPYFKSDGYANGVNWTAFEYFLWKSSLDEGEFEDAWKIAKSALELWQRECQTFYTCSEHFVIRSSRGNGWPHFSSFSTPYSCYFHAFYIPGRATVGFDTQILANTMTAKGGSLTIKNNGTNGGSFGVLLSLEEGKYSFSFNGKKLKVFQRENTLWEITLPKGSKGKLSAEKVQGKD